MSYNKNINIEKRIFKLSGNETFLLEYPSNYEEIANKKINKLEQDYESVLKNNSINNINKREINKTIKVESTDETKKQNNKLINNNESINSENKLNLPDNYYYQPINSSNIVRNEDEIYDNKDNKKENIKLEPQEGFIEIKKKLKNNDINAKINNDEEIMNEEFYEVEEKENDFNFKDVKIIKDFEKEKEKIKIKKNVSPIKNSEYIKNKMQLLNFKAPKWAENMNDIDFINIAKNIISSKYNKK